jgi:hypothetical protein
MTEEQTGTMQEQGQPQPGAVPETARTTEAGRIAADVHARANGLLHAVTTLAGIVAPAAKKDAADVLALAMSVHDALAASVDDLRFLGALHELAARGMPATLADAATRVAAAQMRFDQASIDYCAALAEHASVEHLGGAVRREAVARVIAAHERDNPGAKPLSDTAADKMASEDTEYRAHRERLANITAARDMARARMDVAQSNVRVQERFFDALATSHRERTVRDLRDVLVKVGDTTALANAVQAGTIT